MAFSSKLCLMAATVLLVALMCPNHAEGGLSDCYETWSRCSRWSSWGNGRLWLTCSDRCKDLGRSGGNCRLSPSTCPIAKRAYQCQCY